MIVNSNWSDVLAQSDDRLYAHCRFTTFTPSIRLFQSSLVEGRLLAPYGKQ